MGEAVARKFSDLSQHEVQHLTHTIAQDALFPLRDHVPQLDGWLASRIESWKSQNALVISHENECQLIYSPLKWDTELLGVNCGRVHYIGTSTHEPSTARERAVQLVIEKLVAELRSSTVQLCDARIPTRDLFLMRVLEQAGFHTVDVLVTLGLNPTTFKPTNPPASIRPILSTEIEAMADLSEAAFADTSIIQDRFFLEPMIDHSRSARLFREWFLNACKKQEEGTGVVLVAVEGTEPLGYIAMERHQGLHGQNIWADSLNAVAIEARGKGVYRTLVEAAIAYAKADGAQLFYTKTQVSTARVINSWIHLGANLLESACTLHWTSPQQ
jgi:hypothetical protein